MNQPSQFDLQRLRAETRVAEIDFHWEIESTNSRAIDLAQQRTIQNTLLVLAERQTAGRGRGQNRWWSSEGSITFSLIVPSPQLPLQQLPLISLAVGLAICRAIERIAPQADLGIKWPNDVYLDERKLAGILIELPKQRPPLAVIGVGINVNTPTKDSPVDVAQRAISLRESLAGPNRLPPSDASFRPRESVPSADDESAPLIDLNDVLIGCLNEIDRQLNHLHEAPHIVIELCRAYHILSGRQVEINTYNEVIEGRCLDIDNDGALRIETSQGPRRCLGGVVQRFV